MLRDSLVLGLALFLGAATCEAALKVDINDASANTATQTQPGFTALTEAGTGGTPITDATDVGASIGVSFTNPFIAGAAGTDDRDRTTPATANHPLARLLRDFIFTQGTLPVRGTLDTTISGVSPGNYLLTAYFHDSSTNQVNGDISLSVDGGSTFSTPIEDVLFSTGSNPNPFGKLSIPFTATGADLVLQVVGDSSTVGTPAAELAILNGFVIEPFTTYGDFNGVGGVTVADFNILANNLATHLDGNFVGHAGGDIDLDGDVDLDDFGAFKQLFPGVVALALGTNVPEPQSVVLLAVATVGGMLMARRRRTSRR